MKIPENTKQLAELLHNICCKMNHTDQCAWFYEEAGENTRKYWEDCVDKLVEKYGFQITCDIIVSIRKIQFGDRVEDI